MVAASVAKTPNTHTGAPVRTSRAERAALNNGLPNTPPAAPVKPVARIVAKRLSEPIEIEDDSGLEQGFNDEKPALVAAARAVKATALPQANGTIAVSFPAGRRVGRADLFLDGTQDKEDPHLQ